MRKFLITLMHQNPTLYTTSYGNLVKEINLHNFNLTTLYQEAAKEFGWNAKDIIITNMCDITPSEEVEYAGTN